MDVVRRFTSLINGALGLALALIALYTAGYWSIEEFYHRGLVVALAAVSVTLMFPLAGAVSCSPILRAALWLLDLVLIVAVAISIQWFFSMSEQLWTGIVMFGRTDIALGLVGMAVVIELTRRAMGLPLATLAALAIVYCLFGERLPWIFRHAGFSLEVTVRTLWYSLDGVFGLAAGVMVGLIYVYIVFGTLLEGTGAGTILLRVATRATGRLRGGPAHAAVVSSSLFGTLSGSAAANVVGTGVFTIPMIKRRGFKPSFAAAVEAAASTGGQFLPPVMGAAAFMMSELTGTPYLVICIAALVPALFYYGSLFCAVAIEAVRQGIGPVPVAERQPIARADWLGTLMFLIPLAVIFAVLLAGRSPAMAGFWATVAAVVSGFAVNPSLRRRPWTVIEAMAKGGQAGAKIMIAVAAIGILIGTMNLTGLGLRFSNMILAVGDGSLFVSLVLTMLASLVLGMGLPTLPAYLIIILVMGPALEQLGVPLLIAHLFVLYYGVLSAITPPVAIAAYAAAPIAGANPLEAAVTAVRLALVGFLIPFVFVYNTSLTLVVGFDPLEFAWVAARLALAIWLLTTAFSGADRGLLPVWSRAIRLALGFLVLAPDPTVEIAAGLVAIGLITLEARRRRDLPAT